MSDKMRITFTGGGRIGDTIELDVSSSVLVGRSHSAELRLKEADVSGRHLEIVRTSDGFVVRNLSRFGSKVDGVHISEGQEAPLKKGSVVEVGARERFRVDALPKPVGGGETSTGFVTDQGTATGGGETIATVFGGDVTVATRAGTISTADIAHVSSAVVEESATRDAFSVVGSKAGETAASEHEAEGVLGIADDEAATADNQPEFAPFGGADNTVTNASGFMATKPQGVEIDGDDEPGDGETQELRTRAGSIEEILERKRQLERDVSKKHWKFGVYIVMFLAVIAGIWFATASRRNVDDAEGPFRADGEPDVAYVEVPSASGGLLAFVEYPNDPRTEVVMSAESNQCEIASYIGRDRDIPLKFFFTRSDDKSELELSLLESFNRWMNKEMSEGGFTFSAVGTRSAEVEFWEDVFPGWMQHQTLSGVSFARSEYTHTVGTTVWRGVAYRLRSGTMVLAFRAEIPETYWKRAGYRLKGSPFLGLYSLFIDDQWDPPGNSGYVTGRSESDLVALISHELTAGGPRTWPILEKWIDTLLAMTWGKQTPNAKRARESNDEFLTRKTAFYNERYLAYEAARLNGDAKSERRILEDCRMMFSKLKRERRYYKVNNPEEWKWQSSR